MIWSGRVARSLSRAVRIASVGGGWLDWSLPTAPAPRVGASVCTAATRYARKRVGSFSPASSDSQAAGRRHSASHPLSRGGLPKPAGGERGVSEGGSPALSRSTKRGGRARGGRGGGGVQFRG